MQAASGACMLRRSPSACLKPALSLSLTSIARPQRRSPLAAAFPQWPIRLMTILANPAIDAVLICSPTGTHAELIVKAAQAGKHIFCEKPIAFDLAKIDCALAAVKAAGVQLQIGFNRRFDPNFARVRQAVASGEIGTPSLMHIISRDPAPPPISYIRSSGGIFLDMTIHDFDMARFLIGDEVEEIYTAAGVWSIRRLARPAISIPP